MIIDNKRIARVTIKGPDNEAVAVLTDKEAQTKKGYSVSVILDTSPGPDAIAFTGDVLFYRDTPEQKYVVTQADDKFFVMVPVTVNKESQEVEYDNVHQRIYPNSNKIGTLEDFFIVLEYRGEEDHDGTVQKI